MLLGETFLSYPVLSWEFPSYLVAVLLARKFFVYILLRITLHGGIILAYCFVLVIIYGKPMETMVGVRVEIICEVF